MTADAELRGAAVRGVRWIGAARVVSEVVGLAGTVALARLVSPFEFGQVVLALLVVAVGTSVASQGFAAPLVQRSTLDRSHVRGAGLAALVLGLVLSMVVLVLARTVAVPVVGGATADLLALAAPIFLLAALTAVPQALLERRMDFVRIGAATAAGAVVGAAVSVVLAALGWGAAAIVVGALAGQATIGAVLLAAARPALPGWHPRETAELLRFGLPTMGSGLASVGSQQIDYAVLATRLDPASVGFYWRGYQLGVDYQRKGSAVLLQLALPLYARSSTIEGKRAMRRSIARLQALVLFPLLAMLILLAPQLVPFALGGRWEPAVPVAQILALAGMASAVQTGIGPLMVALGRPGALLRWNLSNLVMLGVLVYVAAPLGLVGLAVAVAAFRLVRFVASCHLLLGRVAGIPMREALGDAAPAAAGCTALLLVGAALLEALQAAGAPDWTGVPAVVAAAPFVYLGVLRRFFPTAFADLRRVIDRVLRPEAGWPGRRVATS